MRSELSAASGAFSGTDQPTVSPDGHDAPADAEAPSLGLRANWAQFSLLVLVNAFVGAMVGLERTVVPLLAEAEFGVASATALLAFVASFGLAKAAANYGAGRMADRAGRKKVLVLGWLLGLPVPLLLLWAPSWGWVIAANVLLGLNQGLAWSATVIMKIDLAGPRRRGLAMGLNESAGYLAVAGAAFLSGEVAARFGLHPEPFYLGIGLVAVGLALSVLLVRDTGAHARVEADQRDRAADGKGPNVSGVGTAAADLTGAEVFTLTSWRDRTLMSCSQAGLVNNLTDGLAWGLLPVFFARGGLSVEEVGTLAAVYPAVWGLLQIGTGALSDSLGRKRLIVAGMVLQAVALAALPIFGGFWPWLAASGLLGLGTALAYPTLLAAVGDRAHPAWRSSAVGTYRLWRDLGYPVGALLAGAAADLLGAGVAIWVVAAVTLGSSVVAQRLMTPLGRTGPTSERPRSVASASPAAGG
jgi:MFS family permease